MPAKHVSMTMYRQEVYKPIINFIECSVKNLGTKKCFLVIVREDTSDILDKKRSICLCFRKLPAFSLYVSKI